VILAAVITGYDAWHKRNPFGPVIMGLCRALVYVTAALAVSGRLGGAVLGGAIVLLLYVVGLSYLARQENLMQVKNWWPLIALAAPFVYTLPHLTANPPFAFLYVGFLGWVIYTVTLLAGREPLKIRRAVVGLIAGISLLDALLTASTGATGWAELAALGFILTLFLQRWAPGT
jgi:4-hydroxybenzoate polyprenyltransferase